MSMAPSSLPSSTLFDTVSGPDAMRPTMNSPCTSTMDSESTTRGPPAEEFTMQVTTLVHTSLVWSAPEPWRVVPVPMSRVNCTG